MQLTRKEERLLVAHEAAAMERRAYALSMNRGSDDALACTQLLSAAAEHWDRAATLTPHHPDLKHYYEMRAGFCRRLQRKAQQPSAGACGLTE
jgi:hypothetical protein